MNDPRRGVVDWPPPRGPRRRFGVWLLVALAAAVLFGGETALSYYVDALWFDSLGYSAVFWKTVNTQAAIFLVFACITFLALYGAYLLFKPAKLGELSRLPILINGQPI